MNVLIVYASNSGATFLSAKLIKENLEKDGNKVELKKANDTSLKDIEAVDLVLIGSTSWKVDGQEGKSHENILDFTEKLKNENFKGTDFALFGCGNSSYAHFCGAVDELEDFVEDVQGNRIVDSLKIDGFFFDIEENTKKINSWASALVQSLPVASIV